MLYIFLFSKLLFTYFLKFSISGQYIDLYSGKASNGTSYSDILKVTTNTYISDGIHLNRQGYNVISPYIYQWMKTL